MEAKTNEEMLAKFKDAGWELTDEQLEGVAGGHMWEPQKCPRCGKMNTEIDSKIMPKGDMLTYNCNDCGYVFEVDGLAGLKDQ